MKKWIVIVVILIISTAILIYLYPNRKLKNLEKKVSNISLPETIEKVAIKSKIGDSGGNGEYSTRRVILVVKAKMSIEELQQEFETRNLKFPKHYESRNNIPIFYITHCKSSTFRSQRDFSISFKELKGMEDYRDYYFIEFIE